MADASSTTVDAGRALGEAIRAQTQRTHAGLVIAASAIIDSELERALKKAMRPLSKKIHEQLFEWPGPMSTFANKILLAHALGITTVSVHADLMKLKELRNIFAHTDKIIHLDSEEVAKIIQPLRAASPKGTRVSEVFMAWIKTIDEPIEAYIGADSSPPKEGLGIRPDVTGTRDIPLTPQSSL